MVGLAIVMFALGVYLIFWAVLPRTLWWKTVAWQFKHPEGAEPSDTAYSVTAISSGLVAIVMFGIGIWFLLIETPDDRRARDEREHTVCLEVVSELRALHADGGLPAVRERAADLGVEIDVEDTFQVEPFTVDPDRPLHEQLVVAERTVVRFPDGRGAVIAGSGLGRAFDTWC